MPFNINSTIQQVVSYLQASGHYSMVMVGEPKSPPPTQGLIAAVFPDGTEVVSLTNKTIESQVIVIRIYINEKVRPVELREDMLDRAVADLEEDMFGDYDLGATIRNIDIGGQYAAPPASEYGYIEVSGTQFRTVEFLLPFIVDDSATLAA